MFSVSIIIPAYNRGWAIENSVRSVLGQTYQHFEVIIVDDGSADDTPQVVAALAKDDQRIRYLRHEVNRGAQAARNTGIRAGQGKWIAFLDSDDQWLPHSLEKRLEVAEKEGKCVIHSDCYVIKGIAMKRCGIAATTGWAYRQILASPGPMFQGFLVTKAALEKIGYLDELIVAWQEWDTAIRLAKYFPFGFVPEPTFVYDCRGTDTISKNTLRAATGYEQVIRKHTSAILSYTGPRTLAQHYDAVASLYRAAGDQGAARRCKMVAIVSWPRPRTILRKVGRLLFSKDG
jgi:glycosyltransferase involved in cell wall biosynthesis